MLILSLILSGLLLSIVNPIARNGRHAGGPILMVCLGFLLGPPLLLGCVLTPLLLQVGLLCAAVIFGRSAGGGLARFGALSFGCTLAAYAFSGMFALQTAWDYARMRCLYPYESMEGRLPQARPKSVKLVLAASGLPRLSRLEEGVSLGRSGNRDFQLRFLHEHALLLFINSPGFGAARMMPPTLGSLARSLREQPVPLQPAPRTPWIWSPGDAEQPPAGVESPLGRILEASVLDFVNPRGFGYFKDRRHVAGFETHRFSQVPEPAEHWRVQTLELVSLLLHDEPVVYVSDHLPRMEPRPDVPTRPLDRFERFGVGALRQGEDLFVRSDDDGLRMVGAIRSTNYCLTCHQCQRGDLLGAFSYTLRCDGPVPAGAGE